MPQHIAEALVIEEKCLSRMLFETKTELDHLSVSLGAYLPLYSLNCVNSSACFQKERGFLETALRYHQSKLDEAIAARSSTQNAESDQDMQA